LNQGGHFGRKTGVKKEGGGKKVQRFHRTRSKKRELRSKQKERAGFGKPGDIRTNEKPGKGITFRESEGFERVLFTIFAIAAGFKQNTKKSIVRWVRRDFENRRAARRRTVPGKKKDYGKAERAGSEKSVECGWYDIPRTG